jgi:hypothetical protein
VLALLHCTTASVFISLVVESYAARVVIQEISCQTDRGIRDSV